MISLDTLLAVFVPVAVGGGTLTVKKGVELVKELHINTLDISDLKEDIKYTRQRVDAIYEHLIHK